VVWPGREEGTPGKPLEDTETEQTTKEDDKRHGRLGQTKEGASNTRKHRRKPERTNTRSDSADEGSKGKEQGHTKGKPQPQQVPGGKNHPPRGQPWAPVWCRWCL